MGYGFYEVEVRINIVGDYAQILRRRLIDIGYPKPAVDRLCDHDALILTYLRVCRRLVSSVPRTIYRARDFACPSEYSDALAQIESRIRKGENVTPYLSRKILEISYNDALLNEWGIQHLHLGTSVSSNPKHRGLLIEGTKKLLYVYFDKQCAYFIKILGHGSDFADKLLIQTIHDNWPEVLEPYRDPHISAMYPSDLTSTDRYRLRKANLNVGGITVSDGTTYLMIGGALATSGDNILDGMQTDRLHHWANHVTNQIITKTPEIMMELRERGIEVVEPVVLRLLIKDDSEKQWFLIDESDRFEIPIAGPWS